MLAGGWPPAEAGPSNVADSGNHLAVGPSGELIITGRSAYETSTTKTQIATWMYDASGNPMPGWPRIWPASSEGPCHGVAVALDGGVGNAFITVVGAYYQGGQDLNIVVLRYNSLGQMQNGFPRTYNDGNQNGPDYPADVAVDGNGIFVLGTTTRPLTGSDYLIWVLNSVGVTQDMEFYNGANYSDTAADLEVYPGNASTGTASTLLVTGTAFFPGSKEDIVTIEYQYMAPSPGLLVTWCERFGYAGVTDIATSCALLVREGQNPGRYVSGLTTSPLYGTTDWLVHGVPNDNTPCGLPIPAMNMWTNVRYGSANKDDIANKIQINVGVDEQIRLYAAGTFRMQVGTAVEQEGWVVAYNPDLGYQPPYIWERASGVAGDDTAVDLASNQFGHVYTIGSTYNYTAQLYDCVITKVHSQSSLILAQEFYNSPANDKDLGTAIEVRQGFSYQYPDVYMGARSTGSTERQLSARYLNVPN